MEITKAMTQKEIAELLFASASYRAFLRDYMKKTKISYRSLASKAGFASKSYLRDVQVGQKKLTERSLPKLMQALELNADSRKYFRLMVSFEEYNASSAEIKKDEIKRRMSRIKNRVCAKQDGFQVKALYSMKHCLDVYASLGSLEKGASLAEVVMRSRLGQDEAQGVLNELVRQNIIYSEKDRYFVVNEHLVYDALAKNISFQENYVSSLQEAQVLANEKFDRKDQLFLNSTYSISKKNMPKLRQELRELLLRFADTTEEAEGDCLARLVVAFTSNT